MIEDKIESMEFALDNYSKEIMKLQSELTELREFKRKVMGLQPMAWKIKFKYDKPENCPEQIITLYDYVQMSENLKSWYHINALYDLGEFK